MKISIACPSWKRPKVETLDYIPTCRIYIDPSQENEYREMNPGADIVVCPEGIQGNVSRVRNYIIKEELKANDAVLIVDDDLKRIAYWGGKKEFKLEFEDIPDFLMKYTIVAQELGAYLWGVNINKDKQVYREYSPFSTMSFVGGPFQCFLKGNNCWYDERLPLKEDYDMTLQQLNKNRVVLRVNKYFYDCKQSLQAGGCAAYRNMEREKEQLTLLQKKWGSKIVKNDLSNRSHNLKKKKKGIDYNPIIRVPIKGI